MPYILWHKLFTNAIFTRCYAKFRRFSIMPNNWGDDINKYFFEYVTGRKVIPVDIDFPSGRYIMIGSILSSFHLNNAVIYGTGLMTATSPLRGVPKRIISVRGPLTRQALLENGIDCPEHYGDPALLLSLFVKPSQHKNNAVSIIPNMVTFRRYSPVIEELVTKHGCRLINMTSYENWNDIIDAITSSEFVISESLHGLIVAETYGIPSVWVEFINHDDYNNDWSFKFRDFYESIGKHDMISIKLYDGYDFSELLKARYKWRPGKIDYEHLLDNFPFTITKSPQKP